MHGGSLRVAAAAAEGGARRSVERCSNPSGVGIDRAETWLDFGRRIVRKIDVVKRAFGELGRQNESGATARPARRRCG